MPADPNSFASPYDGVTFGNPATGGPLPVPNKSPQNFSHQFPGIVDPADYAVGKEIEIPMPTPGAAWQITELRIMHASGFMGTGTTTVVLSTSAIGGGGTTMSVSMDHDEDAPQSNTSGFVVAGGGTLYLYPTVGGVHSDVSVFVSWEAA